MTHTIVRKITIFFSFFFLLSSEAYSSGYSLLNPVPKEEMRVMTTERPSKADSSYTIDAGHLQVETSFYALNKTKNDDSRVRNASILNSTTLRLGINQSTEVQMIVTPVTWQKNVHPASNRQNTKIGFGDTTLRVKYNIMGNDTGNESLAVIPFIKIPTNSNSLGNNAVEGGLSVPFDVKFGDGYSFNYTFQTLALRRSDRDKMRMILANMFVLEKAFSEKFSGFVEYFAQQITEDKEKLEQTLDFGVVYAVSKNITLDSAVNFGLSDRSDDIEIIFGGAYRF